VSRVAKPHNVIPPTPCCLLCSLFAAPDTQAQSSRQLPHGGGSHGEPRKRMHPKTSVDTRSANCQGATLPRLWGGNVCRSNNSHLTRQVKYSDKAVHD
jgi:hypothetical protein